MRDCQPTPAFVLVAMDDGDKLWWLIHRSTDFKVCAGRWRQITDDGVQTLGPSFVRRWPHAELASAYMDELIDGKAGGPDDAVIDWQDPAPFFSVPEPAHVDPWVMP
jgi:hypothetical protein